MPSFRQFLATFILGALLTLAFASAASHPHCASKTQSKDDVKFKELLSSVSNDALHEVLHDVWKKYKHGVYPEDRTAMEAVHQDNAEMATVLIELAKRQSVTNGTTTTSTSTTSTAVTTGTTITTTQRPTTVTGPTTITSTPTTPTSTLVSPTDTSTPTPSMTTITTSSSLQPGTTTVAPSSTFAEGSTTAQVIYTTTLPGGARSTVTYVTVVPAGQAASTPGVTSQTGVATLQTNVAVPFRAGRGGLIAGLGLAGAMMAM